MSDEEDSDWYDILFHPTQYRSWHRIFDYILHFLKSAEWDAAVMGFIDNNCAVFVNDDENKFEYSQIHRAFVDEIEALIDAQLDKVGISNDLLVAACKHARHNREINREVPLIACTIAKQVIWMQVYEQMIAMDDFLVKIEWNSFSTTMLDLAPSVVLSGMMEPVASHIYAGVCVRTVVFSPSCFLDIGPVARIRPY